MLISKSECSVTESDILSYSKKHSIVFPQEYKDFMLKYNGGETPETAFNLSGVASDISSLYELRHGENGLELYNIEFKVSDFLKDKMFPIGENVFGDNIFICVMGSEVGKIFFRYHDMPKKYIKVADTFKIFVQKCKSKKVKPCRTIEERIKGRIEAGITIEVLPIEIQEWTEEIERFKRIHQEEVEL